MKAKQYVKCQNMAEIHLLEHLKYKYICIYHIFIDQQYYLKCLKTYLEIKF